MALFPVRKEEKVIHETFYLLHFLVIVMAPRYTHLEFKYSISCVLPPNHIPR